MTLSGRFYEGLMEVSFEYNINTNIGIPALFQQAVPFCNFIYLAHLSLSVDFPSKANRMQKNIRYRLNNEYLTDNDNFPMTSTQQHFNR